MNNPCYEYIAKLQRFDMIIAAYKDKSYISNYGYLILIQIVHAVAINIMMLLITWKSHNSDAR